MNFDALGRMKQGLGRFHCRSATPSTRGGAGGLPLMAPIVEFVELVELSSCRVVEYSRLTSGESKDIFCPVRRLFTEASPGKMDTNTNRPETNGSILSAKELLELHERVLKRVREMTPNEGLQSLIASGIYTPEGILAKDYGG